MADLNIDQFTEAHLERFSDMAGEPLIDDLDERSARTCLAYAWEQVRTAGSSAWTLESRPDLAMFIAIDVAARGWGNLGGFTDERGDQVTLSRDKLYSMGVRLSDSEKEQLGEIGGKPTHSALRSIPVVNGITPIPRSSYGGGRYPGFDVIAIGYGMNPATTIPMPGLPEDLGKPGVFPTPWITRRR